MTPNDTFDRAVSAWLDEQAGRGAPDYLDDILQRTAGSRQRPAWTSIERWLPVDLTARPPITGSRVPWRTIALLVALALIVAATLFVYVGSRKVLPAPFGLASNGALVYGTATGDISAWDPATGTSKPLISGATRDETPDFARDGSAFVFARETDVGGLWQLMLANSDGSNVRALTGSVHPQWNSWSPDSKRVAVVDTSAVPNKLTIYGVDGSAPVELPVGMTIERADWRTPTEVVFLGKTGSTFGLYAIATDGGSQPRALLPPTSIDTDWLQPELAPDGSKIVWTKWVDGPQIHVLDIATGLVSRPVFGGTNEGDGWPTWSPDATKLLFSRWNGTENHLAVGLVGGGPAIEIGPGFADGTNGAVGRFSPDGTMVIARYGYDPLATWLLDPAGGPGNRLLTAVNALGSWQRTAP